MKIYLTGLPGSGKTTLGKQLAKALNYTFVDLDAEIEKLEDRTIPTIFENEGEDYFRKVEQKVLHKTTSTDNAIISTGGGAPCFFDNAEFINSNGLSIFIDVSPKELAKRISRGPNNRPLLAGVTSLEEEIENKRKARLPFYKKAELCIVGDTIQVNELIQLVNYSLKK